MTVNALNTTDLSRLVYGTV